jgi:hypothetical protein
VVTLARFDILPEDGPLGLKHVGVLIFLISVKCFKSVKVFRTKKTLVQIVGSITYISTIPLDDSCV